ncbi:hypothetical protein PRIPAC_92819 [Pristionchus pacificus]|uniref:Uncharacterized protein n=1 Tax=Pristionchus pacificus TaxID=54126 RepID=A0A2A6CEL6_PRIPA|nr:hypothetical protein PRIPAC_92819 [Pristionchus pacificus]|eukprot:PDM76451.1 hypothetical protein PRIPAC_40055 [Pristionchus pacificus]
MGEELAEEEYESLSLFSFILALSQRVYSKMACNNNNSYQGSYDQHSPFADGQDFLDEEGNAVYQIRPDGSPHFIPAIERAPYQGSYDQYSPFADGQDFLDEEGNAVYQIRPDGSPHFLPAGERSPYQGSYDQYSDFADGQVSLNEEGNAVYQFRPNGSPHLIPYGELSAYQDVQSPGVYSPGLDLGKLEDYGPLALNVSVNDLASVDDFERLLKAAEDDEDTIPYLQVVVPSTQSAPIYASIDNGNHANQYSITMLPTNYGTACSSSPHQHAAFLNDPGHSAQATNHHLEQRQAVSHKVATPTSEVGVQLNSPYCSDSPSTSKSNRFNEAAKPQLRIRVPSIPEKLHASIDLEMMRMKNKGGMSKSDYKTKMDAIYNSSTIASKDKQMIAVNEKESHNEIPGLPRVGNGSPGKVPVLKRCVQDFAAKYGYGCEQMAGNPGILIISIVKK